jgi:hypothetical protein
MPTTRKMLPEFEFRVNVRYDQEFRSRDANQRLRKNHPAVKKIHVRPRDEATQSRDGNSYVKVIIAAPTRAIAKACFDEGNSRSLRRMGNNRTRNTQKRTKTGRGRATGRGRGRATGRGRGRATGRGRGRGTNTNRRTRKTPSSSSENNRPIHYFSEEVTSKTDWGEYSQRCDEFKEKHPDLRVYC